MTYAVWPDPRSRSRALESRKIDHFQRLSPPPTNMGAGKWPRILKLEDKTYSLSGPDFWILSQFLCHVTLMLAVSRSRPSVPYWANLFVIDACLLLLCWLQFFSTKPRDWLGRMSPKWPILCRVEHKTLTQSTVFLPYAFFLTCLCFMLWYILLWMHVCFYCVCFSF